MRHLYVTHRRVPLDLVDDYLVAWGALRAVAEVAGGRAWVFQGASHEDRFLEFIEWRDPQAPLDDSDVAAALTQLDSFGMPTEAAEWDEAN